jgi:TonB family protein
MQFRALIVITLILIFGILTFGQSIPLDSNNLPVNFKPNDSATVIIALEKSKGNSQKGEFETTEQYNNRIKNQVKLEGNKTVDDFFYFLYPASKLSKYDADTQEFTIEIPTESYVKLDNSKFYPTVKEKYFSVELKEPIVRNDGTSSATNAYGARITVTKSSIFKQRLVFTNLKTVEGGEVTLLGDPKLVAKFSLSLAKAKDAKQNLALLYITKLVTPYFETKADLQEATLTKPTEILKTSYYLVGSVIEIWVIDTSSGAVLSKLKPSDGLFTNPISQTVLVAGKVIFNPKPEYPEKARAVRAAGAVRVEIEIDEGGNVTFAKAVSGHTLLRAISEETALKAKFTPSTKGGKPVKTTGVLVYNFVP